MEGFIDRGKTQGCFPEWIWNHEKFRLQLHLGPDAMLKFVKARPVPHAIRGNVEESLDGERGGTGESKPQ